MLYNRQSKLHTKYTRGNCVETCVANLLEINVGDVPDFTLFGREWRTAAKTFFRSKGFLLEFDVEIADHNHVHIVDGKSDRGTNHACLYFDETPHFDPHPHEQFLRKDDTIRYWNVWLIGEDGERSEQLCFNEGRNPIKCQFL